MKILYLPHQYSQQRQHEKKRWIYPVHLAMEAEWYRKNGHEVIWDNPTWEHDKTWVPDKVIREVEGLDFLSLPAPDRIFTNAKSEKYQNNGNFKYHPATYIQVASGCWHGRCTFCVERNNRWKVRPVESVIEELEQIERFRFREVFDDSGTFPTGEWLDKFLELLYYHRIKLKIGCNMRLVDAPYKSMAYSGFRMILFGLESANQRTLDLINKGTRVEDVKYIIKAAKAGIEPHVSFMVGFPNEDEKDTLRTINLIKELLIKGYAKTAQCSFYMPPDGINNPTMRKCVNKFYNVGFDPRFWIRKIMDLKSMDDVNYLLRGLREGWESLWYIQKN